MNNLLSVTSYDGAGIGGTVEGREYTILLLNYLARLSPDKIMDMQRHLETMRALFSFMVRQCFLRLQVMKFPESWNTMFWSPV